MNIKSIVVIILRMYSLNFLFIGVVRTVSFLAVIGDSSFCPKVFISYMAIAVLFLVGISFWVFAHSFANLITSKLPENIEIGTFDLTNSYTIAFLLLGLFFAVSKCPGVLYWTGHIFQLIASRLDYSWKKDVSFYRVLADVIPFVLGLMMIFNARCWAKKLEKYHERAEASELTDSHNPDSNIEKSE